VFVASLVGLGAMVALISAGFMSATFYIVKESTIRSGVGHFQIAHAGEFDGYEDHPLQHGLPPDAADRIVRSLPSGAVALPRLAFEGIASSGDRSLVFLAQAIDPDAERVLGDWARRIVAGQGLAAGDPENPFRVQLGIELARLLGLQVGDSVTLMTPTALSGLNAVDAKVVGLVSRNVPEIDRTLVVAPLELGQDLLLSDRIDRFSVLLDDERRVAETRAAISEALPGLVTRGWRELTPLYDQLVALYSRQFGVFGVVITGMIVIAVVNTIMMAVLERRREIGTLLALGFPRSFLRHLFVLEGGLVAAMGAWFGLLVAGLLIQLVNRAAIQMPPPPGSSEGYQLYLMTELDAALLVFLLLTALGLLAGWLGSQSVRFKDVVEDLRHG
jgi:putative ABC transport system permease protein